MNSFFPLPCAEGLDPQRLIGDSLPTGCHSNPEDDGDLRVLDCDALTLSET
jgi:hypothetical protein